MEKNNNGKLAIAIVAMFVVALSIVGVTYAYFTTTVNGNKLSEEVRVKSGVLRINYTKGTTIEAEDIVPGWKNDGDKFYDSALSAKFTERYGKIYAFSLADINALSVEEKTDKNITARDIETYATKTQAPLHFSVANDSSEGAKAYYGIRLSAVTNTIATQNPADAQNVKLHLYDNVNLSGEPITVTVGTTDGQIITDAIELNAGTDVDDYYAVLEYVNDTAQADQNLAQGIDVAVSVTFEVVGLNKVGTDYVAANGATWVKPASN